jgi:redox-regulated HSP33 family molecular chaperone
VERVLRSLTREEIESLEEEDGAVVATCEFCNAHYRFVREEIDELLGESLDVAPGPRQ